MGARRKTDLQDVGAVAHQAVPLRQKKPPERTASKAVRQHQLIEATIVEIAERGLSSFKLSDVAKTAGVAVGMVNFHFTTKAQLLDQTLDYLSDEYEACWRQALAAAGDDPAARLQAMMLSDFDPALCTRRRIAAWHAFYGEARARPAYRERCAANEVERHAMLVKICTGVIRRHRYKGRDAEVIARTLGAISDGIWLDILLSGGRIDRDSARVIVLAYLTAIFPKDFPLANIATP
jgi:TetR/AcrR family transcriptional repressor of bet genes